jgi:hypothetical protein
MKTVTTAVKQQSSAAELAIKAINLNEIQVNDQFLLRTQNSLYRFLVTTSGTVKGRLLRGEQLISAAEVLLIGSSDAQNSNPLLRSQTLQVGTRAVFQVTEGDNKQRLLTSTITKLSMVKATDPNPDRFNSKTWGDDDCLQALPVSGLDCSDAVDSMFVEVREIALPDLCG